MASTDLYYDRGDSPMTAAGQSRATDDRSWLTADYPELRDGPPWVMQEMVEAERELPAGVAAAPGADALADAVRGAVAAGEPVVLVGCGTSEHGALAVAELLDEALAAAG